jgi:hypothetical protein
MYGDEKINLCEKDFPKFLTNFNTMICKVCNNQLIDMEPIYACGSGGHINKCNPHVTCITRSNNDCTIICQLGRIIF